jgi:hypothetical protein
MLYRNSKKLFIFTSNFNILNYHLDLNEKNDKTV